jgi:hypothetical protein
VVILMMGDGPCVPLLAASGAPPLRIEPQAGLLLLYSADESNIHCVEPVTEGERYTFTMWFTCSQEAQEDTKVLQPAMSVTRHTTRCGMQQNTNMGTHIKSNTCKGFCIMPTLHVEAQHQDVQYIY